ncbi:MAG: hypothetical protein K2J15_05580 [Muribaculaceae bacterium]|nr:hypothetical protein [Muribaculaceae bacterium]
MDIKQFTDNLKEDLHRYLLGEGRIDEKFPECPDLEDLWTSLEEAYLPDGAKEFQDYPIVSLGWIMFVGMAFAVYWDEDWEKYSKDTGAQLYIKIKEAKGYDELDDYVLYDVMHCDKEEAEKVSSLVAECASRTLSSLHRSHFEAGTAEAVRAFQAALHQLYLFGVAMEINALGYHYVPYNPNQN